MPPRRIHRFLRNGMLTQLRVFDAVARHASFTRAGEETFMAQPTVSVLMKKLTNTVGVPLVEQTARRVRLTAAGERVHVACREIFAAFSGLEDALAELARGERGTLRIATTSLGRYVLPQLLAQFVKVHPGCDIALHETSREGVIERLKRDQDDVYLLGNPPHDQEIVDHAIMPNALVAIAQLDHALASERSIEFERFAREPLIAREPGSGTRIALDQVFSQHRLVPRIVMELGSTETIKRAVMAGAGVALLYECALGFERDARDVALLNVQGLPRGAWHLVHRARKKLSSIACAFVEFSRTYAHEQLHEVQRSDA